MPHRVPVGMTGALDAKRLALLRLIRTESIGPVTCHRLLDRFQGDPERALAHLPAIAAQGGRKTALTVCSEEAALAELAALQAKGGQFLTLLDDDYPVLLAAIDDAPPVLSLIGRRELLSKPAVALVGARNASLNARKLAEKLARDCGAAGYAVVSGLARGIDTAVHQGALLTGTVAVVAGGVDVIYPPENKALTENLYQDGLVVSEQPFGMQPLAQHFPRRNRIISGLSQGTCVVEASLKSGSLITARMAAEQGREVFAVPGFPTDPRAQGPNRLLKDGAQLVETADDILNVLNTPLRLPGLSDSAPQTLFAVREPDDSAREIVAELLSPAAVQVDELASACQLSVTDLQSVLLEMELAGRIRRLPSNRVCLLEDVT